MAEIASYNVGISGRMAFHQNAVFLYGNQGGYKLYRSMTNGDSWEDITASAIVTFSDIYSFFSTGVSMAYTSAPYMYAVYVSDNLGSSWSPLSTDGEKVVPFFPPGLPPQPL